MIDVTADVARNADFLLTVERIEQWERGHGRIPAGAWVLLQTGWSRRTDPAAFANVAAEQQNVASMEGMVEIGRAGLRGQQDQPRMLLPPPALERVEARVTHERDLIEIIHPGAAEGAVRGRKPRRLDDMRLDPEAGCHPQDGAGILRNIRLIERDAHTNDHTLWLARMRIGLHTAIAVNRASGRFVRA